MDEITAWREWMQQLPAAEHIDQQDVQAMRRTAQGTQLKVWREQVQLTQAEAAALFGVHQVTYAKWESGLQGMTGAALRLAQVLQTPQGYRLVARLARQA